MMIYNIEIMNRNYGIRNEPKFMKKYSCGTDLTTMHRDYTIPPKDINKIKAYFKKKGIKTKVTQYD